MRSIMVALAFGLVSVVSAGCAPEEKKIPEVTPADKAKLDQQHSAAAAAAAAGQDPAAAAAAAAGGTTAPTAAGHGK